MGEEKKMVKSFRLSEATQEELKQIAGDQSMDDTFQSLISAYREKEVVRNAIDSARVKQLDSLCVQLKELFNGILSSQTTDLEQIKKEKADEIEKLRRFVDDKGQKLEEAQATIQVLKKELSALESDNKILKDLNDSLKGENAALRQNIALMENSKLSADKAPGRKAPAKKKESTVKNNSDDEKGGIS